LAIRAGRPGSPTLVARKVGTLESGFFAAPAYLKRRGLPTKIEQLTEHETYWPMPARGQVALASETHATPEPSVACSDFGLLAELARIGGGIALLPTVYLVSRAPAELPPRVAALRKFLLEANLFSNAKSL
jgi:DNA-binding transcriptional LysR family regulator